jgi:hypothetical protein
MVDTGCPPGYRHATVATHGVNTILGMSRNKDFWKDVARVKGPVMQVCVYIVTIHIVTHMYNCVCICM